MLPRWNAYDANIQENPTAYRTSVCLEPLHLFDVRRRYHCRREFTQIFTNWFQWTIGIGDIPFKQPPVFTRRILYNLYPGFHNISPWEEFLVLNQTPPYISAKPEITHRRLNYPCISTKTNGHATPSRFLILSSDGLTDLCQGPGQQKIIGTWAQNLRLERNGVKSGNMALQLLWQALGGVDSDSVSRVLTLDMDSSWVDDTAILVQNL